MHWHDGLAYLPCYVRFFFVYPTWDKQARRATLPGVNSARDPGLNYVIPLGFKIKHIPLREYVETQHLRLLNKTSPRQFHCHPSPETFEIQRG